MLRGLLHVLEMILYHPLIQHITAIIYLFCVMFLCYWAMLFFFLIPLFAYWKPRIGIVFLLYAYWMYYDRHTPRMGGRKSNWLCSKMFFFDSSRYYFRNRLIKTADLPEGRNYILAHYPHSFLPFNVFPNFLTNFNKVADLFPGIEMKYVTADTLLFIPILREFLLITGGCSCSESSFTDLLKSTPSKGILVVPGGASEMKYAGPGSIYKIIKRKGFIRLALQTGSPVVPVFTFGETNVWNEIIAIPMGKRLEKMLRDAFNSPATIYLARGACILWPKRIPVSTIVGAPISVPKVENPSEELIDEYYEKFFQALQDIFDKYKHECDMAGDKAKLIMTEE